ncbi:MAG: cell division protein FtsH, partial [Deltaproteobacteria bacterium]
MKQGYKTILLWILLIVMFISFYFHLFSGSQQQGRAVTFSEFWQAVEQDNVRSVTIKGDEITGEFMRGENRHFRTRALLTDELIRDLKDHRVNVVVEKEEENPFWQSALLSWLPMILLFVIFIFFMRQLQAGGGKAMSFGKSKAKMLTPNAKRVTFADVAGVDEAKEELQEIIEFLKNPKKFSRLGGRIPKG